VERGPTLHLHGITRVMGDDEHGLVVGRVVTPLARPLLVAPGTAADRAEHVPAHHLWGSKITSSSAPQLVARVSDR
jgi:hypothetical protein